MYGGAGPRRDGDGDIYGAAFGGNRCYIYFAAGSRFNVDIFATMRALTQSLTTSPAIAPATDDIGSPGNFHRQLTARL